MGNGGVGRGEGEGGWEGWVREESGRGVVCVVCACVCVKGGA